MTESDTSSLHRLKTLITNSPEIMALAFLMLLYLFLGNYFAFYQTLYLPGVPTSGGSDPYYNFRVIQYIITDKHFLVYDAALNYPLGAGNPRNPFFHELIVLVATIFSPIYGQMNAALIAFEEYDAVFGALLIIPVFLIGNEIFGKKAGLIGAFLYTLMPSNLSAGILSDGRNHTPELIWAFFTIYFFLKAVSLARKTTIIDSLTQVTKIPGSIIRYYRENKLSSIYALLAGASTGALMLSWQGFAYIVAIILIYIFVQLIANIFMKKPSGYLVFLSTLYVSLAFFLGAYYYIYMHETSLWYVPPLLLSVAVLLFGVFVAILRNRPWIIIIPTLILIVLAIFAYAYTFDKSILNILLSGDGYFIKNRVYDTISEAQAPQLGSYISGFGPAQFLLGMSGIAYVVYLFFKKRSESILFLLVFAIVSIYMSFAAARFNVTAAPAYAILGGVLLVYFWGILKEGKVTSSISQDQSGRVKRLMKGNKSWMRTAFVLVLIIVLVIPSGFSSIAAAVPANGASEINQAIYNELPSILQPGNFSAGNSQFVGGTGFGITNDSTPLSSALNWLGTQDTNQSFNQRPGYVSWWDYGFQELSQGKHPTVADDFQNGYQVGGQVLLAQNNSQIISLFIARILQAEFKDNGGNLPSNIVSNMNFYLGSKMTTLLANIYSDPLQYAYQIYRDPALYGQYIQGISSQNAYFALYTGILTSHYSTDVLVNLYLYLTRTTGFNIQYVGIDNGLFPFSGTNPGIFYAPTYLTDHVSYTYNGEIVPYSYYNIDSVTANATYALNQTPSGAAVTGYDISYNSAFYNSTIYRFTIGYPPSVTGNTSGIPGLTFGQTKYFMMPAWNMSNFEVTYAGIPWNPYTNFSSHPDAWQIIPLQQAYYYKEIGYGTSEIFPPTYQLTNSLDTIVSYYPGAIITGRVTLPNGLPVPGVHVTILDQYGIPHSEINTNINGYYNITAVPGNDTLVFSNGVMNKQFLIGNNTQYYKIHVSKDQAERNAVNLNTTTGLPDYYIVQNYTFPVSSVSGVANFEYMYKPFNASKKIPQTFTTRISSGTVQLVNYATGTILNATITNGIFKFPDIPPMFYDVNLIVDGVLYKNVSSTTVVAKATLQETFNVFFDALFVHVAPIPGSNTTHVSGVRVTAFNNVTSYSNYTNSTGETVIWLNPGYYNVSVNQTGSIASSYQPISFLSYSENQTLNLTAEPGYVLTGTLSNNWDGSQLSLYPNALVSSPITIYPTASGSFSVLAPGGLYTLYAYHDNNSFIQTIYLDKNTSLTVTLEQSSVLTLSAVTPSLSSLSGNYLIKEGASILEVPFQYGASRNVSLPDGYVTAEVDGLVVGQIYTGEKSFEFTHSQNASIPVAQYKYIEIYPYNSEIGSSFNSKTAIYNGLLELYSSGTLIWFTTITSVGAARVSTLNLSMSDLSYVIQAYPFSEYVSNLVSGTTIYAPLATTTDTLNLVLQHNGVNTNYNGTLNLIGVNNYTVPITNGQGTVAVIPGVYSLELSSQYAALIPQTGFVLAKNTTVPNTLYINASVILSVTVSTAKGEYFFNQYGNSVNGSTLTPGNYTIYAISGTNANISSVFVNSNFTYNPGYSAAGLVTLTNSYNSSLGSYDLEYKGMKFSLSSGSYELPYGQYQATVNYTKQTSGGLYHLVGTETFNVTGGPATIVVPASLQKIMVTVSGKTLSSKYAPYSTIEFFNSTGTLVAATNANASGNFSISLSPATYGVYVYNNASQVANVTVFYLSLTNTTLNPKLTSAYQVVYEVTLQSVALARPVNISQGNFLMKGYTSNSTPSNGTVLLPSGIYRFSSSYSLVMPFGAHNVTVSYVENYTLNINGTSFVDIILHKVVLPDFHFKILSSSGGPIQNGSSENFTFEITNLGNVEMNLTLSTGYTLWNMTFNNSVIKDLEPYANATRTVEVQAPYKFIMSGLNTIPISFSYNYTGSPYKANLNVSIIKYLNLNVTLPTFAIQNSTQYLFPFVLNNTGNNQLNVTFTTEYQYFNAFGWNASFVYENKVAGKASILFNQTATVYLQLIQISPSAKSISDFYVIFHYSNITENLTVNNPHYPGSSINTGYPTGPGIISNYTGDPIVQLYIGIIIIAIAVVAGLGISAYRGRKSR